MIRNVLVGIGGLLVGAMAMHAYDIFDDSARTKMTPAEEAFMAKSGINQLHVADSVATVRRDPKMLADLWDSSGVRIVPGNAATVSRVAIYAEDSAFFASNPGAGVVAYAPHFLGVSVHGTSAVEWGYFDTRYVSAAGARPDSMRGNVMRAMRREADGTWKFTHVMWNRVR